jgi:acylphosphatase
MLQTFSITVTGQVQGVYYRQSTRQKARELGITGVVKNNPDGSVSVLATGTGDQLNELLEWCKEGPPNAIVLEVQVEKLALQSFMDFRIQK